MNLPNTPRILDAVEGLIGPRVVVRSQGKQRSGAEGDQMQMFKNWVAVATAVIATGLVKPAAAQATTKIGALNPYSGPLALYGTEVSRAFHERQRAAHEAGRA